MHRKPRLDKRIMHRFFSSTARILPGRGFLILLGFLLNGCAVGPAYDPPKADLDSQWNALHQGNDPEMTVTSSASKTSSLDQPSVMWWQEFKDQALSALIEKALENDNDLKIAEAKIAEARANKNANVSTLFPEIDGIGSVTRENVQTFPGSEADWSRRIGANGTWDLDLFGGNRSRTQSAIFSVQAAEAQRDQIKLMTISDVALNYVRLRSTQRQREITLENLATQEETLKITEGQRTEGAVSDLEVIRAQALADTTRARLPQIKDAEFALLMRLQVLTGQSYNLLQITVADNAPIPSVPLREVVSTPVEAMRNRPDIRAAERQLASNSALTRAAFADFFPKVSLEGFFGTQHSDIFGGFNPWSIALNGLVPVLNFGKISSQLDAAKARQQQAFYTYQQTVLLAVEETENAFSSYLNEQQRRETLSSVAMQQAKAAAIAREQYKAGVSTQLDLLTAESNQLSAENDLVLSQAAVTQNLITLYRALGEGWSVKAARDVTLP